VRQVPPHSMRLQGFRFGGGIVRLYVAKRLAKKRRATARDIMRRIANLESEVNSINDSLNDSDYVTHPELNDAVCDLERRIDEVEGES